MPLSLPHRTATTVATPPRCHCWICPPPPLLQTLASRRLFAVGRLPRAVDRLRAGHWRRFRPLTLSFRLVAVLFRLACDNSWQIDYDYYNLLRATTFTGCFLLERGAVDRITLIQICFLPSTSLIESVCLDRLVVTKAMADATSTGVVIRFHDGKGYGFIKPDEEGEDLFVHQSEIQAEGYRSLQEGQKVKFSVVEKNNRQQAVNVAVVDGSNVDRPRNRDGYGGGSRRGGGDGYGYGRGGRGAFNGNGGGFRSGGGGGDARECYNCGGVGHIARDCSSGTGVGGGGGGGGAGGGCYNCGEFGHLARDCNRDRGGGGGGCYSCGEVGHLARDCTSGNGGGGGRGYSASGGGGGGGGYRTGGGGNCYNCGEAGHFARECPTNS